MNHCDLSNFKTFFRNPGESDTNGIDYIQNTVEQRKLPDIFSVILRTTSFRLISLSFSSNFVMVTEDTFGTSKRSSVGLCFVLLLHLSFTSLGAFRWSAKCLQFFITQYSLSRRRQRPSNTLFFRLKRSARAEKKNGGGNFARHLIAYTIAQHIETDSKVTAMRSFLSSHPRTTKNK